MISKNIAKANRRRFTRKKCVRFTELQEPSRDALREAFFLRETSTHATAGGGG